VAWAWTMRSAIARAVGESLAPLLRACAARARNRRRRRLGWGGGAVSFAARKFTTSELRDAPIAARPGNGLRVDLVLFDHAFAGGSAWPLPRRAWRHRAWRQPLPP